jgi:hypothetical protein
LWEWVTEGALEAAAFLAETLVESLIKLIHGDVESPVFGVRKIRFPHGGLGERTGCPRGKENGLKTACGQKILQNQGKFSR